ncbi:hypothetical protein N8991_03500 [Schleiferiaceae bacterium]|nr:hypothetical protein [Schleiferiaceae bacterium]
MIDYQNAENYNDLSSLISAINVDNTYAVVLFPLNSKTKSFYTLISSYKLNYINLKLGTQPAPYSLLKESILRIYYLWFKYYNKFVPAKIIFYSGNKAKFYDLIANSNTALVSVSGFDYINYHNTLNDEFVSCPYFVFVDEIYVSHPDLQGRDIMHLGEEKYFEEINEVLVRLAVKYNLEPVVCIHPRASDAWASKYRFKTVRGKTNVYIKKSQFIVTHASTAISFAVLSFKPIVQVRMNVQVKYYLKVLENYNRELATDILHYENNYDMTHLNLVVDENLYYAYINRYLSEEADPVYYSKELMKIMKISY